MSSHHNESNRLPQYDSVPFVGFGAFDGHCQPNTITHPIIHPQSDTSVSVDETTFVRPIWDRERRELRLGETVVKRFKWPAENQELILDAFEENGWPSHIDDPLKQHPKICPKRRLHDTIKCLNRKQVNEAIKFRGDGTGQGVILEIVSN